MKKKISEQMCELREQLFYLLQEKKLIPIFTYQMLERNSKGRPIFSELWDINISHSDEYLALFYCPFSEFVIGCDLELHRPRKIDIAILLQKINPVLAQQLQKQGNVGRAKQLAMFYRDWTIREALIKAEIKGAGVLNFKDYDVDHQQLVISSVQQGIVLHSNLKFDDHLYLSLAVNYKEGSSMSKKSNHSSLIHYINPQVFYINNQQELQQINLEWQTYKVETIKLNR